MATICNRTKVASSRETLDFLLRLEKHQTDLSYVGRMREQCPLKEQGSGGQHPTNKIHSLEYNEKNYKAWWYTLIIPG